VANDGELDSNEASVSIKANPVFYVLLIFRWHKLSTKPYSGTSPVLIIFLEWVF
jgi:hypothetical protein